MSRKHKGREVTGWLCVDKAVGLTSTGAVASVKRLFGAAKVGHGGTLDPLASGVLPIALGDATKTVPFVQDGRKIYRFTVRWGVGDRYRRFRRHRDGDQRRPSRRRCHPRAAARLHRRDHAAPAGLFGDQDRGAARLRSRPRGRDGNARRAAGRHPPPGTGRVARSRPCRVRGRMRQGHLCPLARPRYRPAPRLPRPCRGAPPAGRRAVRRGARRHHRRPDRRPRGRRRAARSTAS